MIVNIFDKLLWIVEIVVRSGGGPCTL